MKAPLPQVPMPLDKLRAAPRLPGGLGIRALGSGMRVSFGFRVSGLGIWVRGLGFRGSGLRESKVLGVKLI